MTIMLTRLLIHATCNLFVLFHMCVLEKCSSCFNKYNVLIVISGILHPMGFTYPIPDRWRMCTISYSIPRWRTAISCGQCRSSNMIYYAEMQTFEKLTWLKGTYYTENPSIRFMFVTFQYYCICWIFTLPRLKRKHH